MNRQICKTVLGSFIGAVFIAVAPITAEAQVGQITGTVRDQDTGGPLATVQVYLQGTSRGTLSDQNGRFVLGDVPPGSYTLIAQRIGYREYRQAEIDVAAGQTQAVELLMSPTILALEEIVATGLVDPVEGVRSPVTVGRITSEMMPVAVTGAAIQNLQGRMAGVTIARTSGQPGEDIEIQLRSNTSLTTAGRNVQPLIVVDGVILGAGTTNLESLDIESIEVIKGAAAASLYGSRANAGVIAIRTKRGSNLAVGQTQFSMRSEFGVTEAIGDLRQPTHHHYLMDEAQTTYVDLNDNPVGREDRVAPLPAFAFMDKKYPSPIYNNSKNVFQPAGFQTHNFMIAQNTASTNFAVTLNRYNENGPLLNNEGFQRNSFRINLDHRFNDGLVLSVSGFHSRDQRDNTDGLSFTTLYRLPPDIDLTKKDENGEYARVPDPEIEIVNPLWEMAVEDSYRKRARTLGSVNLTWTPLDWISLSGNASYDRQDSKNRRWLPKGTPTSFDAENETDGEIEYNNDLSDTWNAEAQVQFRRTFGPLNARTTFRGLLELDRNESTDAEGSDFFVEGVPSIDVTATRDSDSSEQEVRAQGFLWDTALDYDGKYIFTVLGRRDGSSLFGPDNRWHNYYRVAGAWRLAEEPWFNLPYVDEFKLSYARGTAGGRPGFNHRYETWNVGNSGISKGTLGNRNLRPEHTLEQEVSLDLIVAGRYSMRLTQAWQKTSEQLILEAVPAYTGYGEQWTNGGVVQGHTTELTIEGQMVTTPQVQWTSMFVADRSRAKLTEWPFPCTSPAWLQRCQGAEMGMIWGYVFATSADQLNTPIEWPGGTLYADDCHAGCTAAGREDEFMLNDEGYLVWVGQGNHYTEGLSKGLWGTSTEIGGFTYEWGMPFRLIDANGGLVRTQMGNASHMNVGWLNNLNFGSLSLHAHLHAKIGGDVINRDMQIATQFNKSPEQDQSGKPDELKKPMAYYTAVQGGVSGSTYYMEDGSYLKLRTASVNYRLTPQQISRVGLSRLGIETMQVGVIGRNLLSLDRYRGWDPEQGLDPSGQAQTAGAEYPPTRSYTAEVSITF